MKKINTEKIIKEKTRVESDKCTIAANPEMIRNNYEDEPCENN